MRVLLVCSQEYNILFQLQEKNQSCMKELRDVFNFKVNLVCVNREGKVITFSRTELTLRFGYLDAITHERL